MFSAHETELAYAHLQALERETVPALLREGQVRRELGERRASGRQTVAAWLGTRLVALGERLAAGGAVRIEPSL